MPVISFQIVSSPNTGQTITFDYVRRTYLFGIPLKAADGSEMTNSALRGYLDSAVAEIERELQLKLSQQTIEESVDFYYEDWRNWNFVKTTYPVNKPFLLEGWAGSVRQISYPQNWLSSRKSSEGSFFRQISLIPAGPSDGLNTNNNIVYSGIIPYSGFQGYGTIPNYWRVRYCTGFTKNSIPQDILDATSLLCAIKVMFAVGNVLIGAGVTSKSLSIDGLSQSVGYNAGQGGVFGSQVVTYQRDYAEKMKNLRRFYRGIGLAVG